MHKISVVTQDKAHPVVAPEGISSAGGVLAYYDDDASPLRLHLHDIAPGAVLRIEESDIDRLAYVWHGSVDAGGRHLPKGSSLIVEHGGALEIVGGPEPAQVLTFAAAGPPAEPGEGGHIHVLPAERVPTMIPDETTGGMRGGMHFAGDLPSCKIWLHEAHLPGSQPQPPEERQRGVHSHTEHEIIFVIDGDIRLGTKLYGAGTAVSIAADTLYNFTAGPDGLSFINFRPGLPGDIQFADGSSMSEARFWSDRVKRPEYLELA